MRSKWTAFTAVVVLSFAVLGWAGLRIYQMAPPIPAEVRTASGTLVMTGADIETGQNVWQSMGGMEQGSIWGHGSYVAPDWSADWLHRESVHVLDTWSTREFGVPYDRAASEQQAALRQRLITESRTNTYDAATGRLMVSDARAEAIAANTRYYAALFRDGRAEYAIPRGTLTDDTRGRQLAAFFFWSSWAASTNRPGAEVTYTSNWPHEDLVGNRPTGEAIVWTGVSIIMLLGGIGFMASWYASRKPEPPIARVPDNDPLLDSVATPSQRALVKYFWIVAALILVQMAMGVIAAHYGVEGDGFYGLDISGILPYSVVRTWHVQLGLFWIATAWLGAGLYITPAVAGFEPRFQRAGVNVLFGALVVVVAGSMVGQWLSIKQLLPDSLWFWFGHSGYEYIDLGRAWQIALLIGLLLWLGLMARGIVPALKRGGEERPILTLLFIATIAIAGFYGAALGYGRHTNLAVAEYWRWWVVHLWVEGFFEVFATVVIAFLFAKLGLVNLRTAGESTILAGTIFLAGGIIGTLHHLYFSGTPTFVLALGSVFSALEVVPLIFVGYEAWENLGHTSAAPWVEKYRWPIYFFVAVAFWNLVGAGLFGFMINPPVALYYMQGLNTTPVHGHAALFGVYGMLGMGLTLFCLRAMHPDRTWKQGTVRFAFWTINIGLFAMVTLSLLPVGLMQTWASVEHGYWYARSSEFLSGTLITRLRWMRVLGDTVFATGTVALVYFIVGLSAGYSYEPDPAPVVKTPARQVA